MRLLLACLAVFAALSAVLFFLDGGMDDDGVSGLPRLPQANALARGVSVGRTAPVRVSASLSGEGDHAPVYLVTADRLWLADARVLARKFGVHAQPERVPARGRVPASFEADDGKATLLVRSDGRVGYVCFEGVGEEASMVGQTEAQAIEEATTFLAERRLLPETAEVSGIRLRHGSSARPAADVWWGADVVFGDGRVRTLALGGFFGGLSFAPQITVGISARGFVDTVYMQWPDLVPVEEYPIISQYEAYERILAGQGLRHLPDLGVDGQTMQLQRRAGPFDLTRVDLVYAEAYEEEIDRPPSAVYLVPVYLFRTDSDWEWVAVPAIGDEYILPQSDLSD